MTGIYKITNKLNNKIYIGQSVNISYRWTAHRCRPFNENSNQYNSSLYKAIRKYGIENFQFEVLEECLKSELNDKEKYYISLFDSTNPKKGYNLTTGGQDFHQTNSKISEKNLFEIVDLLKNSLLSEEEIGKKFNVSQRTISAINLGQMKVLENEIYPIRDPLFLAKNKLSKNTSYFCSKCGKKIKTDSLYCVDCANLAQRKVERPNREKLKEDIRNNSFLQIGKKYNVTDNAIRKWCKSYNLPYRKSDIKNISDEEWLKI